MIELVTLSIEEMHEGLMQKKFSATELTKAHIEKITNNEDLNAFVTKTPDIALNMAKEADNYFNDIEKFKSFITPMTGIPIGIKDLFCTKGIRTTACSKILQNFVPNYESTVSSKLLQHKAVLLGKLNMDEFGMGSANLNSCFAPAKNPHKRLDGKEVVPGGSSGGSSAAVAGFLCAGALGSDTGGSIRQPASFCGIVGLKPTYGRCSRWGIIPFASSLDQAGVLTRTVKDAALMLQSICGHDTKDPTSSNVPVPDFTSHLNADIKNKKIGIPKEYSPEDLPTEIKNAWKQGIKFLADNGAEIIEISLPHTNYALPTYYIISSAEASSNLAKYDGIRYGSRIEDQNLDQMYQLTRGINFGKEVKRRIMIGAYALLSGYYDDYYQKAQQIRQLVKKDFADAFQKIDYILTPTTPNEAFPFDEKPDNFTMYLNDIFTVPTSLAGLPGISIPIKLSKNNLPLSLQIIGNYYDEEGILNIANFIEKSLGK